MNVRTGISGLRVVEVGQIVSAPTAGLILASLGAEVIKVEKPFIGDSQRRAPISGHSYGSFNFFNSGKKSLALDITTSRGKEIFLNLMSKTDILIENLGPGTMDRLGLGPEAIKNVNDKIIYASIKGFGKGPYQERLATDALIEAMSGIAYMTGLPGKPLRVGFSVIDISAGTWLVMAILLELMARNGGNEKFAYIEVDMYEVAAFLMGQNIAHACAKQEIPEPMNSGIFKWAIYDYFETKDKRTIFLGVLSDKQWDLLCELLGLPHKGLSEEERLSLRSSLLNEIADALKLLTYKEVEKLFLNKPILWGPLNNPLDLISDPHLQPKLRKFISPLDGKTYNLPQIPIANMPLGLPPKLGEHTLEILQSLKYSKDEIDELVRNKIIQITPD